MIVDFAGGLCQCGCGEATNIAKRDDPRYGAVKGLPNRFVKGHDKRVFRRIVQGYVALWAPLHPRALNRYVFEHILVAERALGHFLTKPHVVHHIDEDKQNNANSNLCILEDQVEHIALHVRLRVLRAGGNPWTQRLCCECRKPKDINEFYVPKDRRVAARCKECSRERSRRQSAVA